MRLIEFLTENEWEGSAMDANQHSIDHQLKILKSKLDRLPIQFPGQIFIFEFLPDVPNELKKNKQFKKYYRQFPYPDENGDIDEDADRVIVYVDKTNIKLAQHLVSILDSMSHLRTIANKDI